MNTEQYFESLSLELESLKNRVRSFISDAHWLTDGEWKETVIRSLLRRNLPNSVAVGRGFILTPNNISKQIDVLVYDQHKPIPFRDGDLAFITSDTAKLVIEVKTKIDSGKLDHILNNLADNAERCRVHLGQGIVFSLFCYERPDLSVELVLNKLSQVTSENKRRIINFVALGPDHFFRFWEFDPLEINKQLYNCWHAYELPKLAFGYFIHNVVSEITPNSVEINKFVWFPGEGKEPYRIGIKCFEKCA